MTFGSSPWLFVLFLIADEGARATPFLRSDGSLQHVYELPDAGFLSLVYSTLPAKQAGVEFFGKQCVLEAIHRPLENGDDHFRVEVIAQVAAVQTVAHECAPAVRIVRDEEAIDFAT